MPYRCCVVNCNGNYQTGPLVSVFSFPKDEDLRARWLQAISRKGFVVTKNSRVCERHFSEDAFIKESIKVDLKTGVATKTPLTRFKLRKNAIPTIFPRWPDIMMESLESSHEYGKPASANNPNDVPSTSGTSSKETDSSKTLTAPEAGETNEKKDNNSQVWTSLLYLHPIESGASTSGLSTPSTSLQRVPIKPAAKPKKFSSTKDSSRASKPKAIPKLQKKRARSPSPIANVPTENKLQEMIPNLCIVKMEIEDDGYANNEDESFIASLTSKSSPKSQNNTLYTSAASSSSINIKTEPEEILPNIEPIVKESGKPLLNGNEHPVEIFFKSIAETVMQLPPHLIEETKTKVSSLVYDMIIRAIGEGCTNIKKPTV